LGWGQLQNDSSCRASPAVATAVPGPPEAMLSADYQTVVYIYILPAGQSCGRTAVRPMPFRFASTFKWFACWGGEERPSQPGGSR
jgi:hypothetical protein